MSFRLICIFLFFTSSYQSFAQKETEKFTVMAWNILHGGRDIENGVEHVIEIIRELDPDIICMVETYGSGKLISEELGYNFHLIADENTALDNKDVNLSIYSKFPFGERMDTEFPFYLGGREVLIDGRVLRVFSNWFHYLPWENEPEKTGKSAAEIIEWERNGRRYEMIQKVLPDLQEFAAGTDSIPMILAGDMNSPSHLDWGDQTKDQHNGLVVPWYATKVIEDMGFTDTYRHLHPNIVENPGITWDSKGKRDEHRIDYIFYAGEPFLPIESYSYKAHLGEDLEINGKKIPYPSDHGIVLTTFAVK